MRILALGNYLQSCTDAILSKVEVYRSSRFKDKLIWLGHDIDNIIKSEIRKFAFNIVTSVKIRRFMIPMFDTKEREYARRGIDLEASHDADHATLYPIFALAKDKKFIKLLKEIKMDFDDGYRLFSNNYSD